MSLRIRRGTDAQRQGIVFDLGEILYTTDTQKLYVGDGISAGAKNILATSAGSGLVWNAEDQVLEFNTSNLGINTSEISEGANKYFTTGRAQDAAASLFTSGQHSNISFIYDDVHGKINATVALDGVGITSIQQDVLPSLGGNLTLAGHDISGSGNISITSTAFNVTATDVGVQFSNTGDANGFHVLVNTGGSLSNAGSIGLLVSKGSLQSPVNTGANDVLAAYTVKGYYNGSYVPAVAFGVNYASNAVMTSGFPASRLGIVVGNNTSSPIVYTFDNNGILSTPTLMAGDGSAAHPSIGFTTDGSQDTGFFHPGDGIVCVTINGVERVRFDNGGIRTTGFSKVGSYSGTGTFPNPPETGMMIFDTDTNQFKGYNGSAWVVLG